MHLKLVKESEASKAAKIEEGRAYIKSMMAAWSRDYELNSVGQIVKKQKTILYMNQQFSKQKPQ